MGTLGPKYLIYGYLDPVGYLNETYLGRFGSPGLRVLGADYVSKFRAVSLEDPRLPQGLASGTSFGGQTYLVRPELPC